MDKLRRLLWMMGMVPSRTALLAVGLTLTSLLAMIVFGVLLALTHDPLFKVLIVVSGIPAVLLLLGNTAFAAS